MKNKKYIISLLLIVLTCSLALTACDRVPALIRKSEQFGKSTYYGFRSDKWQEIEASYLGAQAACCGPDKPNDDVRALQLYCVAAKFGHKASMVEIGRIYSHQKNAVFAPATAIPLDYPLAHAYFTLSEKDGYEYAKAMRTEIEEKLSEKELARSKRLVADFPNIPCEITR